MKCTSKTMFYYFLLIQLLMLCGCGNSKLVMKYDPDTTVTAFTFDSGNKEASCEGFASSLCVTDSDVIPGGTEYISAGGGGMFDVNNKSVLFSKNANTKMSPASLTKVMTALLALEYGNPDDILTASSNVIINENGAQVMHLKEGDRLTLDQALHALLLYSANDCGVLIAEYLSGSVEAFSELMNNKALSLGATNTHFVNPHGLTDEEHYTTVYDLYLIFNEAIKHDRFCQIINQTDCSFTYKDRDGNPKDFECHTTNGYLSGDYLAPEAATVIGGKTGTTNAAGSCLILLSLDNENNPYISVLLNETDRDTTYYDMSSLLSLIGTSTR